MPPLSCRTGLFALALLTMPCALPAQDSPDERSARAIFAELVGINTTHEHGSTTLAARAVARRLVAAGLPARDVVVVGASPRRQNLVARLRGSGRAPADPAPGPPRRGRGPA